MWLQCTNDAHGRWSPEPSHIFSTDVIYMHIQISILEHIHIHEITQLACTIFMYLSFTNIHIFDEGFLFFKNTYKRAHTLHDWLQHISHVEACERARLRTCICAHTHVNGCMHSLLKFELIDYQSFGDIHMGIHIIDTLIDQRGENTHTKLNTSVFNLPMSRCQIATPKAYSQSMSAQ